MDGTYKITGGVPLRGEVTPIPNKNSHMGALPLSVFASGGLLFSNLPETSDVGYFLEIFTHWGAHIETASGSTIIDCSNTDSCEVPFEIGKHFRGALPIKHRI